MARSGSSSGRSLRGRVLFQASGSGEFTPPQPRVQVTGPSSVSPTVAVAIGPAFVSPPLAASIPNSLEGAGTDMDEERLLGNSVQHMGCREMAINIHNNESESGGQSRGQHAYKWEKELKRPPTFQEVFDKTHKKKGTDQYISDRAREVAESYSQQMIEKYAGEEEQPQLDLDVWVAASGAPKKGHVYGFGHSMDTSRVFSGTSSSASHTSAFITADAPGTSPSEMRGFIQDEISGLESRLAQTMESRLGTVQTQLSQAISQALSQVSIPS
ncbi:hypothetical protein Taro_033333 [Colocasia esculenta]|uniref:Uncharacterized protein n=1 Tax=Colocasia esculenta TaxID=4460 RepID=A0A843VXL3_COLES|nr:hypothetical protein [Colocasia esculenta]